MSPETPQINFNSHHAAPVSHTPHRDFIQKILIVILFALVLALLWQGAEVMLLVFAGLLLATFLRSLSDFLSDHSPLSEKWALTVVLVGIVGVVWLGAWLLSDSMQRQFDELSENLPVVYEQARQKLSQYPLGRRVVEQLPSTQQIENG